MLIEDLIRLGRPLLESGQFQAEDVLRLVSGVEDERVKNFYRHVFVVEVPTEEGRPPRVLEVQQFGDPIKVNGKEDFEVDSSRAVGAPFVLPSGGNPLNPQGRYLPVYPCYDRHFQDFRDSADKVRQFLIGRLERTIGFVLADDLIDAISTTLHEVLARRPGPFANEKKVLGVLILARCEPEGYYQIQPGKRPNRIGSTRDNNSIVPNFERILEGFWESKLDEGKELGSRSGTCSFSGIDTILVSPYCKAWPWAFPTWTCPLPHGGDDRMLVESVALSSGTYRALTLGACVFNRLTKPIDRLRIVPELFSPSETRPGKDQAHRRKNMTTIYGSVLLLPVRDELFLDPERKVDFVEGVQSMLAANPQDPTMADRYMTAVVGFDLITS
jgi:hypothetical protein